MFIVEQTKLEDDTKNILFRSRSEKRAIQFITKFCLNKKHTLTENSCKIYQDTQAYLILKIRKIKED